MPAFLGRLGLLVFLGIGVVGCRDSGGGGGKVQAQSSPGLIARVGNTLITAEQVRGEWVRRSAAGKHKGEWGAAERQELLEDLVQEAAMWEQIRQSGFDQTPEMQKRIRALVAGAYREKQWVTPSASVSEEELHQWYWGHSNQFHRPAAVRAASLLIAVPRAASEGVRRQLAEKADRLAREALTLDEAGFMALVQKHSDDHATRYRGGETGWVTRDVTGREAAWFDALNARSGPGAVEKPMAVAAGYQVVRLLEKRDAGLRPLSEVRERVRYEVIRDRQARAEIDFQKRVRDGVRIEVDEVALQGISLPGRGVPPPSMPGAVSASITP